MAENINLDFENIEELVLFILLRRRRRRRYKARCRNTWTKRWITRRTGQGVYANLLREFNAEDPECFRQFHRLDRESFDSVLALVGPYIVKKNTIMRESIPPGERLSITLRFLATGKVLFSTFNFFEFKKTPRYFFLLGETFQSLSFQFRVGERTVSNIVQETCEAIFATMKEQYMKVQQYFNEAAK